MGLLAGPTTIQDQLVIAPEESVATAKRHSAPPEKPGIGKLLLSGLPDFTRSSLFCYAVAGAKASIRRNRSTFSAG